MRHVLHKARPQAVSTEPGDCANSRRARFTMASEAMPHQVGGTPDSVGDPAVFGVVTVSDRASSGVYQDLSGPAILQFLTEAVHSE